MTHPITYKSAGVDIDAGDALVKKISPLAHATKRAGVMGGLGGFGGLFDLKAEGFKDPILVSGTDGVGTKLKIAIDIGKHDTVGIDLVAMCVNDILVQGAMPLFFMDYFATGKLDVTIASEVIAGIAEGCSQAGASLLGGETAEMPDFYPAGHYDLAGFCVGAVERENLLPRKDIQKGDILVALPSTGFHSNGYSLVRKLVSHAGLDYHDKCPWDETQTLGHALLTPTKIYVKTLTGILQKNRIKALCHITGGGLTENLPRILQDDLACEIDLNALSMPACFAWAKKIAHLPDNEMLKTFNCGIGMVLVVSQERVQNIIDDVKQDNAFIIGKITQRQDDAVVYHGTF